MSQIATTIEQSKKLLGAGLKQESCDMEWVNVEVWDSEQKRMARKWVLNANPCLLIGSSNYIPAWSFGKLWEIRHEMAKNHAVLSINSRVPIEDAIEGLVNFLCGVLRGYCSGEIDGGPRIPSKYLALPPNI